jgi:hypothetical protein
MINKRSNFAAIVLDKAIYVFGGISGVIDKIRP